MTREEAIKEIEDRIQTTEYVGGSYVDCVDIEALRMAVSALQQPEPKKGRWIDYSDEGFVECPFCHSATNCDDNKKELHYCFFCGASMEEGETDG